MYTKEVLKIAEFMGITPIRGLNERTGNEYYYYNNPEVKDFEALPLYNTWGDIMPVLLKIEDLNDDIIDIYDCTVEMGDNIFTRNTKLEAVITFVNWWINK